MLSRLAPRLPAEAGLIVLVALVAALVELPVGAIVAAVFGAWLAIALVEIALARRRGRPGGGPDEGTERERALRGEGAADAVPTATVPRAEHEVGASR